MVEIDKTNMERIRIRKKFAELKLFKDNYYLSKKEYYDEIMHKFNKHKTYIFDIEVGSVRYYDNLIVIEIELKYEDDLKILLPFFVKFEKENNIIIRVKING